MHLNTETAFDMIDSRLQHPYYQFWTEHLSGCDDCRQELDRCRLLHKQLKRENLKSAPEEDIRRAMNLFPIPQAGRLSAARTVFAVLVFDSFAQPAWMGARGTSDARQLVLRAEEFDIHVKIWGGAQRRRMMGQLLPRGGREFGLPARVHLYRNGVKIETSAMDGTGEFRFDEIPDGPLSLQIDLPHTTVIGPLNDPG